MISRRATADSQQSKVRGFVILKTDFLKNFGFLQVRSSFNFDALTRFFNLSSAAEATSNLAPNLTTKIYSLNYNIYIMSCYVLTKFLAKSEFTEQSYRLYICLQDRRIIRFSVVNITKKLQWLMVPKLS